MNLLKQNSLNSSPPLASIAKMGEKKLRWPIQNVFLPKGCISQEMSGIKYTYPKIYDGRKNKLYRGSKDCKTMRWHKVIRKSKQSNDPTCQKITRYYDLSRSVLKKIEKFPKICALFRIFVLQYKVHKNWILTPPKQIETQHKRKCVKIRDKVQHLQQTNG